MYTFIDSIQDLAFLNQELLSKKHLGVDTEFRRTTKDNMKLALLQINDGDEIYLIDTIALDNPEEHASFLFSNSVIKVFHSCKEDLEAIFSWTNQEMKNIFDTKIASKIVRTYTDSHGLTNLVQEFCNKSLDKRQGSSDWNKDIEELSGNPFVAESVKLEDHIPSNSIILFFFSIFKFSIINPVKEL